jgi:hypothetical protein
LAAPDLPLHHCEARQDIGLVAYIDKSTGNSRRSFVRRVQRVNINRSAAALSSESFGVIDMSNRMRRASFVILTCFAVMNSVGAQQPSTDATSGTQPGQPQAQTKQEANTKTASPSVESAAPSPQPAASSSKPLGTVVVNGGPSADILRSARNAGYHISIANGMTRFCKSGAPVGTRFVSESCISEEQLSLFLHRAQDQRDQLAHLLGQQTSIK